MFQCVSLLFIQQLLALGAYATRFEALLAQPTPYIPGYALESPPAPSPTTPPRIRVLRQLARRDDATCGYYSDDGSPNVCGASQYCTTTASGNYGVWNCCNPDSCFLEPTCVDFDTCPNQYCVTSYMYDAETWYSRFMCGDSGGTTYLFYNFDDTPAYTQSVDNQQAASSAAAQSQADESASEAAAAASASDLAISASNAAAASASDIAAQATQSAAIVASQAAAKESSLSAAAESLSQAAKASTQRPSTQKVTTITVVTTNSQGQAETKVVESTSTSTPTTTVANGRTTDAPKKDGMSTGAIAGTAVGSIAGVALLGAGAFILFRLWKKKREDNEDEDVPYMTGVQVTDKGNPVHYPPPPQTYPSPPPRSYPTPPPHQYSQSPNQYSSSTQPYSMTQTGTSTPNQY